jgi:hypothetical protein
LAFERQGLKEHAEKIITQQPPEKTSRYQRTPIDYSILDNFGHGVQSSEPEIRITSVNRAHSVVSGDMNNSSAGLYERWVPTQGLNIIITLYSFITYTI